MEELHQAINAIATDAATGEGGLSAGLLKLSFSTIAVSLLKIVNSCLRLSYFPAAWKRARVRIIKKPQKDSYADVKSYRPISVLSSLSKVLALST